jgi:indolepyruvate ferredoxin oxidoreductase, beta subunit
MAETLSFLLTGVGGQGIILAGDVLANVGLAAGLEAKKAEVHGMSQRGGTVVSHVRWGQGRLFSPLAGPGEVDVLLAFEKLEAVRALPQMRPGGLVLVNWQAIVPITVAGGGQAYPDDEVIRAAIAGVTGAAAFVDAVAAAAEAGGGRSANVVLLGALSLLLERWAPAGFRPSPEIWLDVIAGLVPPRFVELNRRAFAAGRLAA